MDWRLLARLWLECLVDYVNLVQDHQVMKALLVRKLSASSINCRSPYGRWFLIFMDGVMLGPYWNLEFRHEIVSLMVIHHDSLYYSWLLLPGATGQFVVVWRTIDEDFLLSRAMLLLSGRPTPTAFLVSQLVLRANLHVRVVWYDLVWRWNVCLRANSGAFCALSVSFSVNFIASKAVVLIFCWNDARLSSSRWRCHIRSLDYCRLNGRWSV